MEEFIQDFATAILLFYVFAGIVKVFFSNDDE